MKLKLFLLATSAVALASCSSDAVVEDQQAANAIQFSVTAGNASRAASYYCNNEKPSQFNVWAKVKVGEDYKTYFVNESFTFGTDTWKIDGTTERYWPKEEVSFFAVKNQTAYKGDVFADVAWNDGTPTIAFTEKKPVQTEASKQQDLLYAYTKKTKTVADNGCVANLNFRHALSQVVFKAQNKNKNIYVEISEVQVANLNTTGTFTFPTNVTDDKSDKSLNDKHDQSGVIADNDQSFGKWGNQSTPAEFTTTEDFGAIAVAGNSQVINLTNNEAATGTDAEKEKTNINHSLIVLPQTLAPATINSTTKPGTTGAYFKVRCTIWNVSGTQVDKNKDVILYDNKNAEHEAQYIYIPVDIKWEVGKKYIYTFVFSEKGHGGYDEDGNDVLIPIEFKVTVDDFAKGAETNVDADNGNA